MYSSDYLSKALNEFPCMLHTTTLLICSLINIIMIIIMFHAWWHLRQAKVLYIGSERSILAKIRIIKVLSVTVNPYAPVLWGLDTRCGMKTNNAHTHTHTRCACAPRID